jgi:hypothetical protein
MDKFILHEKNYKRKLIKINTNIDDINKKEKEIKKSKIKSFKPLHKEDFIFINKEIKKKVFEKDLYYITEKGDILLNNWIKNQKDPLIIFISEMIPGTIISKDMERFRFMVKTTQTISIEEYRKKKKIGEEGINYLKKLKEKYGNIILKVLWATININNN